MKKKKKEKNSRLARQKKINIRTLVLSEKKNSERNKKPYPPPHLQVKWSVPKGNAKSIAHLACFVLRLGLSCKYSSSLVLVTPLILLLEGSGNKGVWFE